jgi:polyhydroxyalkanoate synthesis regulator phasin
VASGREQYLQTLASLSDLTRTQAERVAGLLAKQGEVQSAQVGRVAEDLLRRTQKNREILSRLVQREVKRQLGVFGMATRDEVARLQQRVRALEQAAERASKPTAAAGGGSSGRTPTTTSRSSPAASSTAKPSKPSTRSRGGATGTRSTTSSTRTRGGGTSSRSTASSPGTRRTKRPTETGTGPAGDDST